MIFIHSLFLKVIVSIDSIPKYDVLFFCDSVTLKLSVYFLGEFSLNIPVVIGRSDCCII